MKAFDSVHHRPQSLRPREGLLPSPFEIFDFENSRGVVKIAILADQT